MVFSTIRIWDIKSENRSEMLLIFAVNLRKRLVKGNISNTLPNYLDDSPAYTLCLLDLNLDLSKPTKDVLELALDRMPKGSLLVFDEINNGDYPGETIAIREVLGLHNLRMHRVREASMAAYVI